MTVAEVQPTARPPREITAPRGRADEVFYRVVWASGVLVLALMGALALLLVVDGWPAIDRSGIGHFFTSKVFSATDGGSIAALLYGTALVAIISMVVAVPVALGTALFIELYAHDRVKRTLVMIVDLLAAVPSLLFGLWGFYYLQPHMVNTTRWLNENLGFIPLFHNGSGIRGGSLFLAGLVVAVMIMPVMTSIIRDVLARVPAALTEAGSALGATRASVIRDVMLPFASSGITGAALLGLGRALGETVAVSTVLAPSATISSQLTAPGGNTISSAIALYFNNATHAGRQTLIAAGLTLFVITLVVNRISRYVVARSSAIGGGAQ